ncbi:Aste57867_24680 [Aphanomyces stellatus]|uniref:Aste57867_24680 protein n=1 Tax=Aphanomyces stellatus TaxID=120398 RepID=A0A485LVC2_9STRA|nr:hypothetical protein As57867_024602 [Aphanomyces stellatus]VFU01317.1 Aste57867_24680 [Aphanomyces stellatus]
MCRQDGWASVFFRFHLKLPVLTAKNELDAPDPSCADRSSSDATNAASYRLVPFGIAYLVLSMTLSIYYIHVLMPSVANDFWWPHFKASGVRTYLGDVVHARVPLAPSTSLDLFTQAIQKDYSTSNTIMDMPLDVAVVEMRANSLDQNLVMFSQYCWVALARTFDLAHTLARLERCRDHFVSNGAYHSMMNDMILQVLLTLPGGHKWVGGKLSHEWFAVVDEVAHWRTKGVQTWKLQLQNVRDVQASESMTIINALGLHQRIQIPNTNTPLVHRGLNAWTTSDTYAGIWNDLLWGQLGNFGLILNSNTSAVAQGLSWDTDEDMGYDVTPILTLVRLAIVQFGSIDVWLVPPPPPLVDLVVAFQDALLAVLQNPINQFSTSAILQVTSLLVTPTPPTWTIDGAMYFGGNPTVSTPYVQESFGFYDVCGTEAPLSILLDKTSVLFAGTAVGMLDNGSAACALCLNPQEVTGCLDVVSLAMSSREQTLERDTRYVTLLEAAVARTIPLNISMVQFTATNVCQFTLTQP